LIHSLHYFIEAAEMKKKNYKYYNLEDFLLDEEFVRWILNSDSALDYYWQNIIANHPEQQNAIKKAKEMILLLQFKQKKGTSLERQAVLGNILKRNVSKVSKQNSDTKSRRLISISYISRFAAVLIIVIIAAVLLNGIIDQSQQKVAPVAIATITKTTKPGQKLLIKLPDGTSVYMNSESSISYPEQFANAAREIKFSGEAYFSVAEDSLRPFLIKSENIITKVLGTSFNLNAYPEEELFSVALITGKVKVLSGDNNENLNVELFPSQKILVNKSSLALKTSSFDIISEIGWKDGILVFNNSSYQEVFEKIARWYGVNVELKNKPNKQWQLKGKFHDNSLNQLMENLEYTHKLKFELYEKNLTVEF